MSRALAAFFQPSAHLTPWGASPRGFFSGVGGGEAVNDGLTPSNREFQKRVEAARREGCAGISRVGSVTLVSLVSEVPLVPVFFGSLKESYKEHPVYPILGGSPQNKRHTQY